MANAAAAVSNTSNPRPVRAPRPVNTSRYRPDYKKDLGKKDSPPRRIAHYLVWAAADAPREYTPVNVIAQLIDGYSKMPTMKDVRTAAVRTRFTSVRKILQRDYGRDLDTASGGARATVDDDDLAETTVPKRARRVQSAKNAFVASVELVDESKIVNPVNKLYMKKSIRDVMRLISTPEFDEKLLPPSSGQ